MKRLFTSAALFLCSLLTFAQFSGSGSGTENDPYLILNPIQLNQLRNFLNKSGVYFKLMADIDLTEFLEDENPDMGWQPVGTSSEPFKGILDGNGRTISGLWTRRGTTSYVGLFGYTNGATLKDLSLIGNVLGEEYVAAFSGYSISTNMNNCHYEGIVQGNSYVGGCAGYITENSQLTNCSITNGTIFASGNYVGGICGYSYSFNTITECCVYAEIKGIDYVGGICGDAYGAENVTNVQYSQFMGNVEGNSYVGGLIGRMYRYSEDGFDTVSDIIACYATGNVIANGDYVGGLIGYDLGRFYYSSKYNKGYYRKTMLSECYYCGTIVGGSQVGGLVGYKKYGDITKSYSNCSINGKKQVGGIIGYCDGGTYIKKNVSNCNRISAREDYCSRIIGFNGNTVSGYVGGLGTSDENKSYNRTIVISQGVAQEITDDLQNGTSVSATTLKLKATYVAMGWDFNDIWTVQETECYPYMQWQTAPPVILSDVVSGATLVSGKCIDGGLITLEIDGTKQQMYSTNHEFSFNVSPLQAGHEVRVSAKADDKEQSYYTTQTVSYLGKGTEADPYQIYTAADLTGVYRKGYFKLMNDIDLTEYINQFSPTEGWESIGREGSETIHFDGNGHKITGLWCNSTRNNTGLFSCFANGTIKNLTVETADGKQVKGGSNTGILIGKMMNGTIENCHVKGAIADGSPVGGLVGLMDGGTIYRSESSVTITTQNANSYIGGLVGEMTSGEIDQCYTTGILTGNGSESYVGGLVGKNSSTVTNSYSEATISSSYNAAGLIAYNYGVVDKCYAVGDLFSYNYAAGVIGYNDGANAVIRNCAAMNNKINIVYESQQTQQGGGYGQRIIGGIKNNAPAPEMNNYALKTMQVSVNDVPQRVYDDIMNGTAKTSDELKLQSTYESIGWDYSLIWGIEENEKYPYLLWEFSADPITEITLDKTALLIMIGNTETLTASVSNKKVNWTSSNEQVATVQDGIVTAVSEGTADITVSLKENNSISALCKVTVTENKDAAIAELQALVDEAQTLYDNSTEGEEIGEYAPGARAALLAVINSVRSQISSTMDEATISECMTQLNDAIAQFESQQVTAGEDTDYSQIDNTLYIERVEAAAGGQVQLSVKMKNTIEAQGYQFDLYLPEGVTVATDEDGFVLAELSTARTTERKTDYFNCSVQADGSLRVLCGSSKGYTFSGNDGEVAVITISLSPDMEEGEYPVILKNVRISDKNSVPYVTEYMKSTLAISSYTLGDVNADGSVDVADFIAVANHILGNTPEVFVHKAADVNIDNSIDVADFIGIANMILNGTTSAANQGGMMMAPRRAGSVTPTDIDALDNAIYVEPITAAPGTQQVLSLRMKNTSAVAGFELNLRLPDGITVAEEDGILLADLSTERTTSRKTDYFNSAMQDDGTLKILCGSSTKDPQTGKVYTFSGNDGEVARITVNIPADYEAGEYAVHVLNAILADADSHKTELEADITSLLTVEASDGRIHFAETDTSLPAYTAGDKGDITMARTIKANEWSTLVLPFNLTRANATKAFGDDVQFATFSGFEVDYGDDEENVTPLAITVQFSSYTIPARGNLAGGTPVLIKTGKNISEIKLDGVTLVSTVTNVETADANYGFPGKFIGTFVKTTVPEDGLFLSGNKFWYSTGKTNIKAFRGWFELGAVLNKESDFGANVGFMVDGEPASVDGIPSVLTRTKGDVYTIQGQYVGRDIDLKRLPRGIYIIDGKKKVIK